MVRCTFILLVTALVLMACSDDESTPPPPIQTVRTTTGVDVPPGVSYKEADAEINSDARAIIATAVNPDATKEEIEAVIGDQLIIGPGIWDVLKDAEGTSELESAPTEVIVPYNDRTEFFKLSAVTLQKHDEARKAWDIFRESYELDVFEIRPLTTDEMALYWAIIPFPIEEPVFVLATENNEKRILMDLIREDKTIFWMDDLTRLTELIQPENAE